MQLTRDTNAPNFIRAYEQGRLRIGERWIVGNVIVAGDTVIEQWSPADPGALTVTDLEPALALAPTILLVGTGAERLLPDVTLMAALASRAVGLEIMTTAAACRTFNVLLQEERRVAAALLNPQGQRGA
jgi:uncharacterized protein